MRRFLAPFTRGIDLTDLYRWLNRRFDRLERIMATVLDNLAAIKAKADANGEAVAVLASAFTDLASDVRAALTAAQDPSVDEQAALDALSATLDTSSAAAAAALADIQALDTEVGDADGSDTPAETPAEDAPTEG